MPTPSRARTSLTAVTTQERLRRRQYSQKVKKINYVQVYYPCRAAGPAHSKYPAFISLTTNPHAALHGGKSASTFTNKITDSSDPKAVGDTATVTWTVSGVKFSQAGLSGDLNLAVSGPSAVCPFTLKNKHLTPLVRLREAVVTC